MISEIIKWFPNDKKTIYIRMSGGVDSSLAAFLMAKIVTEKKLNVVLQPVVVVEPAAPFQEIFVRNIIKIIESQLLVSFNDPLVFNLKNNEVKVNKFREIERDLSTSDSIFVSGITRNPKSTTFIEQNGLQDDRMDEGIPLINDEIFTPFVNLDKKEIALLYKELNLMESLFPYTRSCVSQTNDFSKHCGECWWCKEREWAFGSV